MGNIRINTIWLFSEERFKKKKTSALFSFYLFFLNSIHSNITEDKVKLLSHV